MQERAFGKIDRNGAISKNTAFAGLNNESLKNLDNDSLTKDDELGGIGKK
jgi:hypothetical protein